MAKKPKVRYNRIKEVLASRDDGMNQTLLAARINKSRVVVSNYVNNNTQPSLQTLKKIADVLGVKIKDLIND